MDLQAGTFDVEQYASELEGEPNTTVGTRLLLENDRVRVWELGLEPGERAPFHWHFHPNFFVCVEAGRARSRFPSGDLVDLDYEVGATWFSEASELHPEVHDLENVGTTRIRFTTVELL